MTTRYGKASRNSSTQETPAWDRREQGARRVAEQRVHEAEELVARDVARAAAAGVPHRHIPPGRVVHGVARAKPADVLPRLHRARHQACAQRACRAPSQCKTPYQA